MTDCFEIWLHVIAIICLSIVSVCLLLLIGRRFLRAIVLGLIATYRRWRNLSWVNRLLVLVFLGVDILYGGSKARMASIAPAELSSPIREVTVLSEYHEPIYGVPDEDVFVRPENAVTPNRWINHAVSDDWQLAADGFVASAGGVVAMADHGFSNWSQAAPQVNVYAPCLSTLSLVPGISDFWSVTNDWMKRFVWKNAFVNRNPTNQISFAVQLWDCGDVAFVYDRSLTDLHNVVPFVQLGTERCFITNDITDCCAMYLRRNHTQNDSWWLKHHPEFCRVNELGQFEWTYDTNEYYRIEIVLEDDETMVSYSTESILVKLSDYGKALVISSANGAKRILCHGFENEYKVEDFLDSGVKYRLVAECRIRSINVPHGVIKRRISERCFEVERPIVQRLYRTEAIVLDSSDHVASEITVV